MSKGAPTDVARAVSRVNDERTAPTGSEAPAQVSLPCPVTPGPKFRRSVNKPLVATREFVICVSRG
jgi:hypothetical protein